MPPPRPATEARSGSLESGRPSRARSANTRYPTGRPHTPPADLMYATDVRQTDVRQHHRLMPPGGGNGHNNEQLKYTTFGALPMKHTLIVGHPDTVLHNGKTDNDRQIINKQHAAAEINQHTNQHNKQKQHKSQ